MALYLMPRCAEVTDDEESEVADTWRRLPEHPEDFCWRLLG
jgi:hypothetical protein